MDSPPSGLAAAPAADSAPAATSMALGAILITSAVFLLFIIFAVGILCLQCCINHGARTRLIGGGGVFAAASGARDKGVDPELLRSLPITVYRATAQRGSAGAGEDAGVECAVCLSELVDGEQARFLPRCRHGFHARCVDMWLASHSTCPLCRLTVARPDTVFLPVAPEPANYHAAANLPASVLLGVSDRPTLAAVASDGDRPRPRPSALVIDIPEPRTTVEAPRDAAKTPPGSARLRSLKRLWTSFGRQGGPSRLTPSCSYGSGSGSGTPDTHQWGTPRAQL